MRGHTNTPVLGDRHAIGIEIVNERQVELIEEQSSPALAVVVIDTDERNFVTEFRVCLPQKRGLGPTGQAPRCPHVDHGRAVELGQHLLETGQVDRGQFGRSRLGGAVRAAGGEEDEDDEETTHLVIMGWHGMSPGQIAFLMARRPQRRRVVASNRSGATLVAVGVGAGLLVLGLWAMVDPQSFFNRIALFEPYNQHFLQDLGALQIGLGAVLLLAGLIPRLDALTVALVGVGIGAALHAVSHVIGIDLGGRPAIDIPLFGGLAVILLVAGVMRWRRH